jgi:hypothetical protein
MTSQIADQRHTIRPQVNDLSVQDRVAIRQRHLDARTECLERLVYGPLARYQARRSAIDVSAPESRRLGAESGSLQNAALSAAMPGLGPTSRLPTIRSEPACHIRAKGVIRQGDLARQLPSGASSARLSRFHIRE